MSGLQQNHIANAATRKVADEAKAKAAAEAELLARVDTISKNARGLWFGLLAALVFSGITLLQIEDIDFFGVNRATQLPLVGVSVPVTAFFAAGGALTTAIYVYFHLYLVQLIEALGEVGPIHKGVPLSKAVYPWMVTDALIRWRNQLRDNDGSAARRTLGWLSSLISFFMVWFFGLSVIAFFWWRSMPAHNEALTLLLGALLGLALWVGLSSIFAARAYLAGRKYTALWRRRISLGLMVIIVLVILPLSWLRTEGGLEGYIGFSPLAVASMPGKHIAELPSDWRDRDLARKWFRKDWCIREGLKPPCPDLDKEMEAEFESDFKADRKTYLDSISKPILKNRDLRKANLFQAFLPGVDFRQARLEGANLREARLEGANLSGARLGGANLSFARLEGANLHGARLEGADFFKARLEGANLSGAWMEGANLSGAQLERVNFNIAGVYFGGMDSVLISSVVLEGANLSGARLEGADLSGARLVGALLVGDSENPMLLESTDFRVGTNALAALKSVDFSGAVFDMTRLATAFGDATVILPETAKLPCHWVSIDLGTDDWFGPSNNFISHWRGWVEANDGTWPTSPQFENWKDVIAIPPPPECPLIKDM